MDEYNQIDFENVNFILISDKQKTKQNYFNAASNL